jgi:hypothetical protein
MRKNSYTVKVRNKVLSHSLRLDKLISIMLGELLGIDSTTTITLGNKSSALPFKSKVELLVDIGALDKIDKNKLIKFMEIRNQFAHNISAESFGTCFESIDGLVNFLKKNYPNAKGERKSEESLYERQFEELSNDLFDQTIAIDKKVKEEGKKHLEALYKTDAFDILVFSVENMAKVYLEKSAHDSPEYVLAKRMKRFVEAAKESLAENMFKKSNKEDD